MPSDYTFIFPRLSDPIGEEEKGRALKSTSKSILFSQLLQKVADSGSYHKYLTLSQYSSLKAALQEMLDIPAPDLKTLQNIVKKYPDLFYHPIPLQILVNVVLEARNQSIQNAMNDTINRTEEEQINLLLQTQRRLVFTYSLFLILAESFYKEPLQVQRPLLIFAFFSDIRCMFDNISTISRLKCCESYHDALTHCFDSISGLGELAFNNICPEIAKSTVKSDHKCYTEINIEPLYWNHAKTIYFLSNGENGRGIDCLSANHDLEQAAASQLTRSADLRFYLGHVEKVKKLSIKLISEMAREQGMATLSSNFKTPEAAVLAFTGFNVISEVTEKQKEESIPSKVESPEEALLAANIESLKKENADLNYEMLHNPEFTKEQEKFDKEIAALKKEITTLTQENGSLDLQVTKAERLKEQNLAKNMQQAASLTETIGLLQTKNASLHQSLEAAKARQKVQQISEIEHQKKIEDLKKEKIASLVTQKEYEQKLLDIQASIQEARLKETQLLQAFDQLNLEKEKTEKIQPLKKQVHELRVENIRLHTQTQSLKYTLKKLIEDKEKFDLKKGLEYADLRRDAAGFENISKLLRESQRQAPILNPSGPPALSSPEPYAVSALPPLPAQPILNQHIPAALSKPTPDPLKNYRRFASYPQVKSLER